MTTLRLIGWDKGLQTVSLISDIHEFSDVSLSQAKGMVEKLLSGEIVELEFSELEKMQSFRRVALSTGVKCEE